MNNIIAFYLYIIFLKQSYFLFLKSNGPLSFFSVKDIHYGLSLLLLLIYSIKIHLIFFPKLNIIYFFNQFFTTINFVLFDINSNILKLFIVLIHSYLVFLLNIFCLYFHINILLSNFTHLFQNCISETIISCTALTSFNVYSENLYLSQFLTLLVILISSSCYILKYFLKSILIFQALLSLNIICHYIKCKSFNFKYLNNLLYLYYILGLFIYCLDLPIHILNPLLYVLILNYVCYSKCCLNLLNPFILPIYIYNPVSIIVSTLAYINGHGLNHHKLHFIHVMNYFINLKSCSKYLDPILNFIRDPLHIFIIILHHA